MQNAHLDDAGAHQPAAARSSPSAAGCRSSRPATSTTSHHEDARAHEALLCIQSGDSLKNPNHWKLRHRPLLLQDAGGDGPRLPRAGGRDAPHARGRRALQRRDRARADPAAEVPRARTAATRSSYLVELCEKGLDEALRAGMTPELHERLQFELKTIREMGFTDYFLIVCGLHPLREAQRRQRRPRAAARPPARSSRTPSRSPTSTRSATACSSSASSTPAASRCPTWTSTSPSTAASASSTTSREKYGRDRVAQIITFWTMAARAAVRDAGRVLDIPYGVVDKIAKLDPGRPGPDARRLPQAGRGAEGGLRRRPDREGDRRPRAAARRADARRTRSTPPAS